MATGSFLCFGGGETSTLSAFRMHEAMESMEVSGAHLGNPVSGGGCLFLSAYLSNPD